MACNTTIGGSNPAENNVIAGNVNKESALMPRHRQRRRGQPDRHPRPLDRGPVLPGRQRRGGRADQRIEQCDRRIGTSTGNVISGNGSDGIQIVGTGATRIIIGANLIGLAPGGGYRSGSGDPGNGGDGILIASSTGNVIGGPDSTWANTISSNSGDGVLDQRRRATANSVLNNLIGLTSDGKSVKGNLAAGVEVDSAQNTIGPGNVISGNLLGVKIAALRPPNRRSRQPDRYRPYRGD